MSPQPFCAALPWPCCCTGGCSLSLLPSKGSFLPSSPPSSSPASVQLPRSQLIPPSCISWASRARESLARLVGQDASPSYRKLSWLLAPSWSRSGKPCAACVAPGLITTQCTSEGVTRSRGVGPLRSARDSVIEGSWLSPALCWHFYTREPVMPPQGALALTAITGHFHQEVGVRAWGLGCLACGSPRLLSSGSNGSPWLCPWLLVGTFHSRPGLNGYVLPGDAGPPL